MLVIKIALFKVDCYCSDLTLKAAFLFLREVLRSLIRVGVKTVRKVMPASCIVGPSCLKLPLNYKIITTSAGLRL